MAHVKGKGKGPRWGRKDHVFEQTEGQVEWGWDQECDESGSL